MYIIIQKQIILLKEHIEVKCVQFKGTKTTQCKFNVNYG